MARKTIQEEKISVPIGVFDSLMKAHKTLEAFQNDFEDFLMMHDQRLLKRLQQARRQHLAGRVRNLNELAQ